MGSACCTDNRTIVEKQVDDFIYMLRYKPDLTKYAGNTTNQLTLTNAWASGQFGGNIYTALGAKYERKDKAGAYTTTSRTRANTLHQKIKSTTIQSLYGGGYYKLEGVRQSEDSPNYYMDIYLLTEQVTKNDIMKKMKDLDTQTRESYMKNKKPTVTTPVKLTFDEIKESVTGFARIVYYKTTGSTVTADNSEIEQVVEGEFVNGKMEGYARGISAINGSCAVGFHSNGIPNGKWCLYHKDGHFTQREGIYEGKRCVQPIQLKTFEQAILPKTASA